MRSLFKSFCGLLAVFAALLLLHLPLLRLPYFWDEAGYYIPAALDFYHSGLLIPISTLHTGHTPLMMIYLGVVWRLFGCSVWAARAAMTLAAAGTVAALYVLSRRVASREIAAWSVLLLALSPLFFAQSTLIALDLPAALFTTLATLSVLRNRYWLFALAASLAVLTKETAVILLPVVWVYEWKKRRAPAAAPRARFTTWLALCLPLVPLAAWAIYYHHATGFWTGNREYLTYNVYSTLSPARIFWSLLRRGYELFFSGFNWLLTGGAVVGIWRGRKHGKRDTGVGTRDANPWRQFLFLAAGLIAVYLVLLSVVGGAVLPRYLLPVLPVFYLATAGIITTLPPLPSRALLAGAALCFVAAWFINPPYPFPFEDNLSYADFIRLHQQAASYLQTQPGQPRILTAWPATDELTKPALGYVAAPLRVVPVQGFASQDFGGVAPGSFDLVYFYSRRWEPPGNWVQRFPFWLDVQGRYFDYQPQTAAGALATRYHLSLLAEMRRRGQWVRIYRAR